VRNEREFMGKGLYVTIKGYLFVEKLFTEICRQNAGGNIVITGSGAIAETLEVLRKANRWGAKIRAVVEGKFGDPPEGIEVIEGRISAIEGNERVESVAVETGSGQMRLPADAVIVDFESYMRRNSTLPYIGEIMNDKGFIEVNASMRTKIPGVFAAGDITGPPFSAGKAAGQGITAGLEAHCYVHTLKFGERCPGYAFYPMFENGEPAAFEVKTPTGGLLPRLIGDYTEENGFFTFRECRIAATEPSRIFLEMADGRHTMDEIAEAAASGGDDREIRKTLEETYRTLVLAKDMTVHRLSGGGNGSA